MQNRSGKTTKGSKAPHPNRQTRRPPLNSLSCGTVAGVVALILCLAGASAQTSGETIRVLPQDMPAPFATPSSSNSPSPELRAESVLPDVPSGFTVSIFADGLGDARKLLIAPDGKVLLAESDGGRITLLSDPTNSGKAVRTTLAYGFDYPFGMAFHDGALYVADLSGVWRLPYDPDGKPKKQEDTTRITPEGAFGGSGGHRTRSLVFSPDGKHFYVGIGSRGNIDEEAAPRATIQEFAADGSHQRTFASGTRNPIGLAFHPTTGALFTTVNERDGLGDGLVPDYFTHIQDGAFYGWPYAYIGQHAQPELGEVRPDLVAKTIVPDVLMRPHSAPIDFAFYTATQFPAEWRGSAFVALHGSWNAHTPAGYAVVSIPFLDGRPTGSYTVFMSGFQTGHPGQSRAYGRPAGVAVAPDGSLLVSDDFEGIVWRVRYGR